jgi:hypothetical protein
MTEQGFQSSVAAQVCGRIGACCSTAKQPFDEAMCESQFIAATFPNTLDNGADAGTTSPATAYDATAAAACLDKYKSMPDTCDSLFPADATPIPAGSVMHLTDACQRVYAGTKNSGEPCASTADCAPDAKGFAYCNPNLTSGDSGSGMGTCQKIEVVTGQCGDKSQPGAPGSFYICADGTCSTGFCNAISGPGGTCKPFSSTECDKGLSCVNDVCVAPPAVGEACPAGQCATGAYCDSGTCVAQKAAGAACISNNDCAHPNSCQNGTCALPAATMCTMGH